MEQKMQKKGHGIGKKEPALEVHQVATNEDSKVFHNFSLLSRRFLWLGKNKKFDLNLM